MTIFQQINISNKRTIHIPSKTRRAHFSWILDFCFLLLLCNWCLCWWKKLCDALWKMKIPTVRIGEKIRILLYQLRADTMIIINIHSIMYGFVCCSVDAYEGTWRRFLSIRSQFYIFSHHFGVLFIGFASFWE